LTARFPFRAVWLAAALVAFAVPRPAASADIPEGVWLIEPAPASALRLFECGGLVCGSVVWLRKFRDSSGQIQHDRLNPDPSLRSRLVCGMTVLWGLVPTSTGKWTRGWFYNPDDGKTYRITAQRAAPDAIVARIYVGIPLFGESRTLRQVPRLETEGWC
jgi:uncharacterized protein (DUF2147 family)